MLPDVLGLGLSETETMVSVLLERRLRQAGNRAPGEGGVDLTECGPTEEDPLVVLRQCHMTAFETVVPVILEPLLLNGVEATIVVGIELGEEPLTREHIFSFVRLMS